MIRVLFFAEYRERLGCDQLELSAGDYPETLSELCTQLGEKGDNWRAILSDSRTLIAINQSMNRTDVKLSSGDEVAFFPPVTGG